MQNDVLKPAQFRLAMLRAIKNGPDDLAAADDPTAFIAAVADAMLGQFVFSAELEAQLIRRELIAEIGDIVRDDRGDDDDE
jgi:hypothetical protein